MIKHVCAYAHVHWQYIGVFGKYFIRFFLFLLLARTWSLHLFDRFVIICRVGVDHQTIAYIGEFVCIARQTNRPICPCHHDRSSIMTIDVYRLSACS